MDEIPYPELCKKGQEGVQKRCVSSRSREIRRNLLKQEEKQTLDLPIVYGSEEKGAPTPTSIYRNISKIMHVPFV